LIGFVALASVAAQAQRRGHVAEWLTTADRAQLVALRPEQIRLEKADERSKTIVVDDAKTYQTVDGFGFAMTGGSAQWLHRMDAAKRHALLEEIFGRKRGQAAVSYLRVSVGSSDLNDHVFTYDDLPQGESDPGLKRFSIAEDEKDLIPVLKEVLKISPKIQILASPWSAPSWMKTNDAPKGGSLKPELYPVYAQYLVRYLEAMQREGVPITAITMQNEPENPKNTPSMVMTAPEQAAFLGDDFGPALRAAGLKTKVVLFDHNCDHPKYPIAILKDAKAAQFADGSGFHLYKGEMSAMSTVHDAFPQKNIYFTEQMVVERTRDGSLQPIAKPVARIVIGAMRNWSRNVLLWNLAADSKFEPHSSNGGCSMCQGAVTIDGDRVTRNIGYYTVKQVSEFVPPGSVRIDSTEPDADLQDVAWRTPTGKHVLLVANTGAASRSFTVCVGERQFEALLGVGDVGTFVW
jgi:glucosylceramidase